MLLSEIEPKLSRVATHQLALSCATEPEVYQCMNAHVHLVYTAGVAKKRLGIARFTWSDPYWPDDDSAGYVHSMAIRTEMHGQDLGGAILQWAAKKAQKRGKAYFRLDCLASNDRLRRYYESHGFIYRMAVTDRDYVAALYEKEI